MKQLSIFYILLFLLSCNTSANKEDQILEKRQYLREANPVDIIVLQPTAFKKELVSNGHLKARRKSILKSKISEVLAKLNFRNGDFVQKGAVIAELDTYTQLTKLENAKLDLKKAELELADFFLGHGNIALKDSLKIEPELFEIGKIRSGYASARSELKSAQSEYEFCFIMAPFSGIMANLKYKVHEQISSGEEFCTLIDDREFELEFNVLEMELKDITVSKAAKIIPFSLDRVFMGQISEINPVVDENGLVTVKALLKNNGELMEGMNVKIYIESLIPDQLVVPKEAVVLRQNQEVLFKVTEGKAYWTYVKSMHENSRSFAVIAHPDKGASLQAGDTVIVSGNLNLAHESEVEVKE